MRPLPHLLSVILLAGCATSHDIPPDLAAAQTCPAEPRWNDPAPPGPIHGNTWYVGTCGPSALLVTSPQGHVLIDGTTEQGADLIEAKIDALGFKLGDVRYILNSHAHLDHAGGIATLARDSGAEVMAGPAAIATLRRGGSDRSDPQYLTTGKFPPIIDAKPLLDGQMLVLGSIAITAHAMPGHTPGGTRFSWQSCDAGRCLDLVHADSLTAISDDTYRYSDDPVHPGVVIGFKQSIDKVDQLPCDILLTTHPSASDVLQRLGPQASKKLIDPSACSRYAANARNGLQKRIAREQEPDTP